MLIALLIFLTVFALPALFRELRRNKSILFAYLFVITLHQVVAVTNAFLFTTLGASKDAATFHHIGVELAQSGSFSFAIGSEFYINFLGIVYWLFEASHFLGEQISILAFSLSCVVLIKILRQMELLHSQVPVLLVFGALPTMVLLGSITMRESYQILFFMLSVYFGIKMHLKGGINSNFIVIILSAFVMGLFHKGLIVYMLFLITLFMVFSRKPTSHVWRIKKLRLSLLFMLPILFVGVMITVKLQISGLGALSALANLAGGEYSANYRANSSVARASYGVALDLSSSFTSISSALLLYVHYLFAPFPWQIRGVLDIYAVFESILRMVFLYYSVKHWRKAEGEQRRLLGLMLLLFFSMSFLWAMGTTNYGTAIRHHMLSWWILVVMGVPPFMEAARRFRSGSDVSRHSFPILVEKNR